jgi:hypothetical protein
MEMSFLISQYLSEENSKETTTFDMDNAIPFSGGLGFTPMKQTNRFHH